MEDKKMDRLIEILEGIKSGVDFKNQTAIVDEGILDSLSIARLIGELEDEFDVEFEVTDLVPENFNSIDAMMKMIERLEDE